MQKYANLLAMPELDSVEKRLNPFGVLSKLAQETPIRYDSSRGCWDVFRYEDVQRILKDPQAFSSVRSGAGGENLLFMDPPKHTQMRELVNKAFTPRAVQALALRIQAIADELLDAGSGEELDVVAGYATPLPVIVIAELLGAPAEDRADFKRWSDALVESAEDLTDEAFERINRKRAAVLEELMHYFRALLELRARQPKDDLISALLAARVEGERLTERELISFCILLLAAGNETTTNLITNAVRVLTEQPRLQEELTASPEGVAGFIEEVLRYYPPIVSVGRVAARDVPLGDHTIRAGQQVISWIGTANRDEAKFTEPDRFDLHRKPNVHMSFGFGIHFCLGAPLARLEGKIAVQTLLERYRELRLLPDQAIVPIPSTFVYGVKNYPVAGRRR
ncbi:cytochrome P450 [Paenibacillus aurantius]|uniref:Cytochrome P450 n=1 Tax=Paenibacillus aurantius TaxID=2918900 RepID=A0AA96LDF2_9BACL|nr:cytochrome P450 [Paenibacillus aurantius]WNQ11295.1 cytochrome P450 [Paenibacillus aurantius]